MNFKTLATIAALLFLLSGNAVASPTLSKNSRGNDVLILQKKLYLIGYDITELDGVFGNETEKAVTAFQKDQKITANGVVTNVTWRALKKAKEKKGRTLPAIKTTPAVNTGNYSGSAPYGKPNLKGRLSLQRLKLLSVCPMFLAERLLPALIVRDLYNMFLK